MNTRTAMILYALCLVAIGIQAMMFYAWDTGALKQINALYHGFKTPIPALTQFGIRTGSNWWLAPVSSLLLLSLTTFIDNRSRLIFIPLTLSAGLALLMLYITYPIDALIRPGQLG